MKIEDGGGTGIALKISDEGMAKVDAVSATPEHHINHVYGKAYNASFQVNPSGVTDCIFYFKNQDEIDCVIEGVWLQSSAQEEILLNLGEIGTAVKTAGADITPVNLNAGSGNTVDCLCYSNTDDQAVDITGLSGGNTFQKIYIQAIGDIKFYNFEADIILPKNQTFSMYACGGDTLVRGTVTFSFHNKD